jgi:hypothetical protein
MFPRRRPKGFHPHTIAPLRPFRPKVKSWETDPRNILSRESTAFIEPEYLNDVGFHLSKNVSDLRYEVFRYREQLREFVGALDPAFPAPYEALIVNETEREPGDISNYLAELDADYRRVVREIQELRKIYSEESQRELETDITVHHHEIVAEEIALASLKKQICAYREKIDVLGKSSLKEEIDFRNKRVKEMKALLKTLRSAEKKAEREHLELLETRATFSGRKYEVTEAKEELKKVKGFAERKRGEVEKMKALHKSQLAGVCDAIKQTQRAEHAKRETALWREDFREQQALMEANAEEQESHSDIKSPETPRVSRRCARRTRVPSQRINVALEPEEIHLG